MTRDAILQKVDHTVLAVGTTISDVKALIDDAIKYNTYSVCISPCFVKEAKEYANERMKICTVIGFPSGNNTSQAKVEEARDAIENGADELDMVINIGMVKSGRYEEIFDEIKMITILCHNLRPYNKQIVVKVIIETCLLTNDEIIKLCKVVKDADADFIKTSTGFSTGGATFEVVQLMKQTIDLLGGGLKIKAAGGITSFDDAEKFINLGADRLGTSRLVKLLKE